MNANRNANGRDTRRERTFGTIELFCDAAIEIGGQKLVPDASKAYCQFEICFAWPSITAYGTAAHPGTIAHSYPTMLHQVFNLGHKMRAYDPDPEKKNIPHDQIIGSVVAVEFPRTPAAGWPLASEVSAAPRIRAAAVIHKNAERVPRMLGEHLAGRHKWTVSQEINYHFGESGWVVLDRGLLKGGNAELAARTTPREFDAAGLAYIPMADAPGDLVDAFDDATGSVNKKWGGSRVVLLKGGVNGDVHYQGVGLVRYGAEREAEVKQMLAADPNRLWAELDGEGMPALGPWVQTFAADAAALAQQFRK